MSKGNIINRKLYNDIRRMDHNQMSRWAEELYKTAYRDGKDAAKGLTVDELKEVLCQQKGIGEKRTTAILEAIENKMKEKESA